MPPAGNARIAVGIESRSEPGNRRRISGPAQRASTETRSRRRAPRAIAQPQADRKTGPDRQGNRRTASREGPARRRDTRQSPSIRRAEDARSSAPHELAVLADPVFSADDERVELSARTKIEADHRLDQAGSAGSAAAAAKIVSDVERSATDSGVQFFRRLLFSRQEAEAITGLLPAAERLKALDFAADRRLALSGKLGAYRILHFATHGLLNNKRPALSGLVLSLVDEHGRPRNGFLRLHEIYNLKLNADLVVLSGCQTALGMEISGEGLIGLTRGFMHAGAPRVIASLWNVNDQATANLMKMFGVVARIYFVR
ncbi:MAG TPA: CHAT domain-containing protein [Blastocatellia bacterium]